MAGEALVPLHVDRLEVGGATRDLARLFALAIKENGQGAAYTAFVERCLLFVNQSLKTCEAFGDDVIRDHLRLHIGCGGAGAGRVFEGIAGGVIHVAGKLQCAFKVLIGFSGKADDKVGGEGYIRARFSKPCDDVAVVIGCVLAVHGFEDFVRAALHWQVQEGLEFFYFSMGDNQGVIHVAGVGGRVT